MYLKCLFIERFFLYNIILYYFIHFFMTQNIVNQIINLLTYHKILHIIMIKYFNWRCFN